MDATYVYVEWDTVPPDNTAIFWTAYAGFGAVACGVSTQPMSTQGNFDVTTTGVDPALVFLASACEAVSATKSDHARIAMGFGTSSTSRACVWAGCAGNNASPTDCSSDQDSAAVLKMMTENGATPTIQAEADIQSLGTQKFTLAWDDGAAGNTDGTAREFGWIVFGADYNPTLSINYKVNIGGL